MSDVLKSFSYTLHGERGNFALGTQRNLDLYSIGSRRGFALGVTQILAFLDTNMLVYPTQKHLCWVLALA